MQATFSPPDKQRLTAIYKRLDTVPASEGAFAQLEGLFYEAIAIARAYGNNEADNGLLQALKDLERTAYGKTQLKYDKGRQREATIKRFKAFFKKCLRDELR